jgi:uncharacterized protein (TIGR00297 family)
MTFLATLRDPWLVVLSFLWICLVIAVGEAARRLGPMAPHATRKLVHMGVAFWALPTALWFDSPWWAAACPLTFVLLNALSYRHRLMAVIEEEGRGSPGTIYFPLVFAGLILLLWPLGGRAASVAGLYAMGFGDAAASIVGRSWGRHRYTIGGATKTWEGTVAVAVVSFVAIFLGTWAIGLDRPAWIASAGAALVAAVAEAPVGGGLDNVTVPIAAALTFWGLNPRIVMAPWIPSCPIGFWAFGVNLALATLAWRAGTVRVSGFLAGVGLGTVIYAALDWRGFAVLVGFTVLGSLLTRWGYSRKAALGAAEAQGGARGASNALAKIGIPAALSVMAWASGEAIWSLAFTAALATGAMDTAGSEVGPILGRRTISLRNFLPVPAGTPGAISLEGTLAGAAAALLLGGLGAMVGLLPARGILAVVVGAIIGNGFEGLLGSRRLLPHAWLNVVNLARGAAIAGLLTLALWSADVDRF